MASSSSRARFDGDGSALLLILEEGISSPGVVQYSTVMNSKVDVGKLKVHGHMLRELHRLMPSLCFKRSTVEAALKSLAKKDCFKLSALDQLEFSSTVAKRLAVMCRHISQALSRSRKPRWATELMDIGEPEPDNQDIRKLMKRVAPEADNKDDKSYHDFFIGWDAEMKRAWRCKADSTYQKEFALPELLPQDDDMAPPLAKFSDGSTFEITELTSLAAKNLVPETVVMPPVIHWRGRTESGAPVIIKDRTDRHLLVSMFLSGKQVLQVPAAIGKEKALQICVTVAKSFVEGALQRSQLYIQRNKLLKAEGFDLKKFISKKPASSEFNVQKTQNAANSNPEEGTFEESGANAKFLDISGGSEEVGEQLAPKETMSRVSKKAKKKQPRQQSFIEGPPLSFAEIFGL